MSYMSSKMKYGASAIETEDGAFAPSFFGFLLPLGTAGEGATEHETANLTVDYDFGDFSLVAASSWFSHEANNLGDVSQPTAFLFGLESSSTLFENTATKSEIFAQEIRLVSHSDGPLNWTVGAFYKDADVDRSVDIDYSISFAGPNPFMLPPGFVIANSFTLGFVNPSKSYAVFGELDYAFSDTLSGQMGLRYYKEDRQASISTTADPLFQSPLSVGELIESEDSAVSPAFSLSWNATEDTMLFARAAKGFRGGTVNAPPVAVPAVIPIPDDLPISAGPEELWSYEVGVKSTLAPGVILNVAAYYIDWDDLQMQVQCCAQFHGYTDNLGAAESKGVELELFAALPVDGLNLLLTASYVDTEIKEGVADEFGVIVAEGASMPFVPDWKWHAALDYSRSVSESLDGRARLSWSHRGDSHTSTANIASEINQRTERVDLVIGLEADEWSVNLFAENLLDERGTLQNFQTGFWATRVPVKPRTVGIRFSSSF